MSKIAFGVDADYGKRGRTTRIPEKKKSKRPDKSEPSTSTIRPSLFILGSCVLLFKLMQLLHVI